MRFPECKSSLVGFVGQPTFFERGVSPTMFSWGPCETPRPPGERKDSFATDSFDFGWKPIWVSKQTFDLLEMCVAPLKI